MVDEHRDPGVILVKLKEEKEPSQSLTTNKGKVFFIFEDKDLLIVSPKSIPKDAATVFTEHIVLKVDQLIEEEVKQPNESRDLKNRLSF
jgi:hypothetical protein